MLTEILNSFIAIFVITVAVSPLVLIYLYALFQQFKSRDQRKTTTMVNKIIEKVEEQKMNAVDWISVKELKELAPEFRKTKRWENGLKYLEDVDLRYRFGMKEVNGEEHKIIYTDMDKGKQ
jgi:hypothetical protein